VEGEIEERGKVLARLAGMATVLQTGRGITQLVKERMHKGIYRRQALCGRVFEQLLDQVQCLTICLFENLPALLVRCNTHQRQTNLIERMWFDLWELVLHVVWIHRANLVSCRRSKNLDNLHQLIDATLAWK
jgi:hypothetical protein